MGKILLYITLLLQASLLNAQNDLVFYHLGDATPQSMQMNAAFFPASKFYVSLPGLSGIHVAANNGFSFSDLFVKVPGQDSVEIDGDRFLKKLKSRDFLNVTSNISIFQFGISTKVGNFSVFVNERISGGLTYPKKTLSFLWNGNGNLIGETFAEDDVRVKFNYFREFGVGYAREFQLAGRPLKAGLRVKMLQGLVNAESDKDFGFSISTQDDQFYLDLTTKNPEFRTAGIEADKASYFINNGNKGIGFDLGAIYDLNENIKVSVAVNDLGTIKWKDEVKNYTVTNNSITFKGIDFEDADGFSEAIADTLKAKFNDETNTGAYSSGLSPRTFVGGSYTMDKNIFSATISNYFLAGNAQTAIGLGYTRIFGVIKLSGTISKMPQQLPSLSGGFALDLGPFQMYMVMDNLLGYIDMTNAKYADFRMGINLLFGRGKENTDKKKQPKIEIVPIEVETEPAENPSDQ
ncbi:MAG: DUF5723 family protein [Bacteroidetes bacterium]|nr:DUF5723 family protein [Bacteroidota bacterium]